MTIKSIKSVKSIKSIFYTLTVFFGHYDHIVL